MHALLLNARGRRGAVALVAALVALAAGCAQTPAPLEITETQQAVATVEAIDQASRLVTLKAPTAAPCSSRPARRCATSPRSGSATA